MFLLIIAFVAGVGEDVIFEIENSRVKMLFNRLFKLFLGCSRLVDLR